MKATPLLFREEMILALLDLKKTKTRRLIKLPCWAQECNEDHEFELDGDPLWPHAISRKTGCLAPIECPYGSPGDLIWVRESGWMAQSKLAFVPYAGNQRAVAPISPDGRPYKRCVSIHMPRWASRITLRLNHVSVERLQDISYEEACAEGCDWKATQPANESPELGETFMECGRRLRWPQRSYAMLWDRINGAGSWAANPLVWVLGFEMIRENIQDVLATIAVPRHG